jgi:hypothetical protein
MFATIFRTHKDLHIMRLLKQILVSFLHMSEKEIVKVAECCPMLVTDPNRKILGTVNTFVSVM